MEKKISSNVEDIFWQGLPYTVRVPSQGEGDQNAISAIRGPTAVMVRVPGRGRDLARCEALVERGGVFFDPPEASEV